MSRPEKCSVCGKVKPVCCADGFRKAHGYDKPWCEDCCPNRNEPDHVEYRGEKVNESKSFQVVDYFRTASMEEGRAALEVATVVMRGRERTSKKSARKSIADLTSLKKQGTTDGAT